MKGMQNLVPLTGTLSQSVSNTSYVPILQGILDGIGWKSPAVAIHQKETLEAERHLSFQEAEQLYQKNPTVISKKQLLSAIDTQIDIAKFELRRAKYLQKEAHQALMRKAATTINLINRLGNWLTEGFQYAFDSTPEQLVKRYNQIARNRKAEIKKLSRYRDRVFSERISKDSPEMIENLKMISGYPNSGLLAQNVVYPSTFNLSDLDYTMGLVDNVRLPANFFYFGDSVSNLGDFNGDGIDDFVSGGSVDSNHVMVCVIFGSNYIGSMSLNLDYLSSFTGFVFDAGEDTGNTVVVSNAGDINADGFADLLVYIPYPGNSDVELVYVVFGNYSIGALKFSDLNGKNGFLIKGMSASGSNVNYAGDINDDGIDDIIIASGNSYVIFGKKNIGSNGVFPLSDLNGSNGFVCYGAAAGSGSYAGDINDDGIGDLLMGTYGNAGVFFGNKDLGATGYVALSDLINNSTKGFLIAFSPTTVSEAGDVNGDGIDDFIISDFKSVNFTGTTYVIFGQRKIGSTGPVFVSDLNGTNGFKLNGVHPGDQNGYSNSQAGDFNNDGIDDFIIGASRANDGEGVAYVIFGNYSVGSNGTIPLSSLNGNNGFSLYGAGSSVSYAGDINNDGIDDLLIGSRGAGNVYGIFGDRSLYPTPASDRSRQIILICIAASTSLVILALIYCAYKKFYRANREEIQKIDTEQDHSLQTRQKNLHDSDSVVVSDSLIPYQTLRDPLPAPVLSLQNYPSPADNESQDSKKNILPKSTWESTTSYEIPRSELTYDEEQQLGYGAYGTVYRGTYKDSDVAVKKLINRPGKDALAELKKEFKVLSKVRSPYIVQFMGVCLESSNCFLVMELMPKGSLYQFLSHSPELSQELMYRIALHITRGLLHLHQAGIIHRDLKSLNVLLGLDFSAKLTDFGQAKIKSQSNSTASMRNTGTLGWNAPELFDEKAQATEKSDIYSLGMLLWELMIRPYKTPFFGLSQAALITAKLKRPPDQQETIPESCPTNYAGLLRSCWQKPQKRPTAKNLAQSLEQLWQSEKNKEDQYRLTSSNSILSEAPRGYASNPSNLSNLSS